MDQYTAAYKQLNQAQRQAVDTIDGPVLVIAGPGTGKTQLLTTRIATILATTDTAPENILCLTFTDAAAATMRERLTNMIGASAFGVTISTYHAFGSELLHRYPDYFVDAVDLVSADNLRIDQIVRGVLAELPYTNPLKPSVFVRDIKALLSDYKRALLTPDDIRMLASQNEQFIALATELTKDCLADIVRLDKQAIPKFQQLLDKSPKVAEKSGIDSVVSIGFLWRQSLTEALETVASSGKTAALTRWKNTWLAKDGHSSFIPAGSETIRKQRAMADIYEQYLAALQAHGLYDYDDMILQAIRGLEKHPDLRFSLQERYQYLLLDEFQDTNAAQLRLVTLLTDNPVNEGRPNVLAVGDDDQAIYAFQGADYSHMLQFYNHYRDVLVVPLIENYRSSPDILALASNMSNQIDGRLHHNFPLIDKTLQPTLAPTSTDHIGRYEFQSDLAQNAWIASTIKQLIKNGMPASAIAVLAPKHIYLESLVPFLREQQLPIHYEKRENVLDDRPVQQLVLLSRLVLALAHGDESAASSLWPQVLSLPFWGLATSQIWQLSWQAKHDTPWTSILVGEPATRHIALFFIRLSLQVAQDPLELVLDYLSGVTPLAIQEPDLEAYRSPYYAYYFGDLPTDPNDSLSFWQLLSNLTVLRQHIRSYKPDATDALLLPDLIDFVDAHTAAGISILNTSPYQEADDALQLMTAYKAKGQEFAAVFVVALSDEVWGSRDRAQTSRIAIPENLRFIRYAGASEDERLRLFYVALTRAKRQLYLTNFVTSFSGARLGRLKYMHEQAGASGEVVSPFLPVAFRQVQAVDVLPPELTDLHVYWQGTHRQASQQPSLRALLQPRLTQFQLSATQLNRYTDTSHDGPTSFLLRDLLRFPSGSSVSGMYGDAVHQTLHWIYLQYKKNTKLPTTGQATSYFQAKLDTKQMSQQDKLQLLERGSICLAAYLQQRAHTIHAADYSEHSFRGEAVLVGPAHLTGTIDRLLVDAANKTVTIVDFKTSRSHSHWTTELKLHAYRQQLEFYKLLVEGSTTFRGYRVVDAYLEFVEPDEHGVIQELHISFNDAESTRFKALVIACWQHVQALDFPDVSQYSKDVKGITAFEQFLIAAST